jgi:hypothetical protein
MELEFCWGIMQFSCLAKGQRKAIIHDNTTH